jgi:hypothetical protein
MADVSKTRCVISPPEGGPAAPIKLVISSDQNGGTLLGNDKQGRSIELYIGDESYAQIMQTMLFSFRKLQIN